jgi:hypothetical protein
MALRKKVGQKVKKVRRLGKIRKGKNEIIRRYKRARKRGKNGKE